VSAHSWRSFRGAIVPTGGKTGCCRLTIRPSGRAKSARRLTHALAMFLRSLFFLLIATWSAAALSAPPCGNAPDHASERACWIKAAKNSDARVHAAQELQRQRIKHWDQEATFRSSALTFFNKAASTFAHYRQAQCDYEASAAAGGNGAGDMRLSCQVALNEAYLKSLQAQASWFSQPNG